MTLTRREVARWSVISTHVFFLLVGRPVFVSTACEWRPCPGLGFIPGRTDSSSNPGSFSTQSHLHPQLECHLTLPVHCLEPARASSHGVQDQVQPPAGSNLPLPIQHLLLQQHKPDCPQLPPTPRWRAMHLYFCSPPQGHTANSCAFDTHLVNAPTRLPTFPTSPS